VGVHKVLASVLLLIFSRCVEGSSTSVLPCVSLLACLYVSFGMFVYLFWHVCVSLLACVYISFVICTGLFCHMYGSLLSNVRVSFVFNFRAASRAPPRVCCPSFCGSLLSSTKVSFVIYVGVSRHMCGCLLPRFLSSVHPRRSPPRVSCLGFCGSLLSSIKVSFVIYVGVFCHVL